MANAQGIRAGRAYVELGVSDKLTAGLRRAQQRLKAFGAGVQAVGMGLIKAAALVAVPLLAATKIFSGFGDQVAKMARRTGFSVEALSELRFVAAQTGTSLEALENGLRRMQRSIYDAERGLSTAVDGLADMNLKFQDLKGKAPEEQFKMIGEAISQIENPTKKAALAMVPVSYTHLTLPTTPYV